MERGIVVTVVLLLLSQSVFITAFPFWGPVNDEDAGMSDSGAGSDIGAGSDNVMMKEEEEDGSGASGESGEGEDPVILTLGINDYVFRFFAKQRELKEKNCSTLFLGQNVSENLCNSNQVNFLFPERVEGNETQGESSNHELCSTDDSLGTGEVLGYDMALYTRPLPKEESSNESRELSVFLVETVRSGEVRWQRVIGEKKIAGDSEGWQVFHLSEEPYTPERFCIEMHVVDSVRGYLNYTLIKETFVVDISRPEEHNKQPVIVKYVHKQVSALGISPFVPSNDPFPFLGGSFSSFDDDNDNDTGLPPTDSREKRSDDCTLQTNLVTTSDYFTADIVAPKTVDVGSCFDLREYGKVQLTSGLVPAESKPESLTEVCRSIETEDLEVLLYSGLIGSFSIDTIPNAIIKNCGHVPVKTGTI